MAGFRFTILACLLLLVAVEVQCQPAGEDPMKGGLVRKAVARIIARKKKYPNYSVFISQMQLATADPVYNTTNLDPLFGSTALIPNNAAAGKILKAVSKGLTYIYKIIGYSFIAQNISASTLKAAKTTAYKSAAVPPLFTTPQTIYLSKVLGKPSFYVITGTKKIVSHILTYTLTPPDAIISKALNSIGVDNVFLV